MRNFWPSLFAFLIAVFIMIGLFRPDLMDAALFYLGMYLLWLGYVSLAALIVGLALVAILAWRRQSLNANRPIDGAFPLQRYRLRGGRTLIVNPNTMISPAAMVDREGGYSEWEHHAGWHVVARIREAVERTNMVRAMFPGDSARSDRWGAQSEMPRINASTFKALEATPPKIIGQTPQAIEVKRALPPVIASPIDPADAISTNTATRWAVGQDSASGEVVRWNVARIPHVRWHGATQNSGKTNACKTLLIGALLAGCHVIICDRRRFKDFGAFRGKAEWVATNDPQVFVTVLQRLAEIYQARDRLLAEQGATNIGELRGQRRYVVMVTEFGALCMVAKAEGIYDAMMQPLTLIMREAGATGVHLIFEDQVVEKGVWPGAVLGNATAFVGRLPSRAGQAVGYYHSDKLEPFQFYYDGQLFKTWDMRPVERRLLATVPAFDPRLALGVREDVHQAVHEPVREERSPEVERDIANTTNVPDEQGKWYEWVKTYMAQHPRLYEEPPQGIRAMARAMAVAETGSEGNAGRYVGIASQTAKLIREARNNASALEQLQTMGVDFADVRLPSGDKLGVDLTTKRKEEDTRQ